MVSKRMTGDAAPPASLEDLAELEAEAQSENLKLRKFGSYPFFDYGDDDDCDEPGLDESPSIRPLPTARGNPIPY